MYKERKLLLVVADGEHVRFLKPGTDHALHGIAALDSMSAHKRSSDLGSDHPGAAFHSSSSARHSENPREDLHTKEKQKFAQLIAGQIGTAMAGGGFDGVVIAAPAHTLAEIRAHLPGDVAGKVAGTLNKDLVKTPDDQLWPHVREWFAPVHRPAG